MVEQDWESIVAALDQAGDSGKKSELLGKASITKAQEVFWDIASAPNTPESDVFKTADVTGGCSVLTRLIDHLLESHNRALAIQGFRRISQQFAQIARHFGERDLAVRRVESRLYAWYLHRHQDAEAEMMPIIAEASPAVVRRVEDSSTYTGPLAWLTGHTTKQLTENSATDRHLLTGPNDSQDNQTTLRPQWLGHTLAHETIGDDVNHLVEANFSIGEILIKADQTDSLGQLLGQLFTAILAMVTGECLEYVLADKRTIKRSLARLRQPARLQDEALNIFANLLLGQDPKFREAIGKATAQLIASNQTVFEPLAEHLVKFEGKKAIIAKTGTAKEQSSPEASLKPENKSNEVGVLVASLQGLAPFDRLCKVYASGVVDLDRLGKYPEYCREIISLIICGRHQPSEQELNIGFNEWQRLVHPDKGPTASLEKISQCITALGLQVRRQMTPPEAALTFQKLFSILEEMYQRESVIITSRQGRRQIIIGGTNLADLLEKEGYRGKTIRTFVGGKFISPDGYASTQLHVGDLVEVIVIE